MSVKFQQALAKSAVRGLFLKDSLLVGGSVSKVATALVSPFPSSKHVDLTLSLAALNINRNIQTPPYLEPSKARIPPPLPLPLSRVIQLPQIKQNVSYEDQLPSKSVEDPNNSAVQEKRAARLVVIRRKKMKKHKLKKLRKKMKFEWAKVRQKRELKKEKLFQAGLIAKIKEAEAFDPAKYAAEKIAKAKEVELPQVWYGVKYPEFIIKQLMEEQEQKKKELEADEKRRSKMSPWVKDYLKDLPK